jgi:hypothetical protein
MKFLVVFVDIYTSGVLYLRKVCINLATIFLIFSRNIMFIKILKFKIH